MNITGFLVSLLAQKAHAFEESTKDPVKAQEKVLLEYLGRNQKTEYGKRYHFESIDSIDKYRLRVPLTDYEKLRQYISHMLRGRPDVLTSDRVIFFSTTTGTTAKPKYIPETEFSRSKKTEAMNLWGYYIGRDHPDIFKGKVLAIISPEIEGHTGAGIPCGAESGRGYKSLFVAIKSLYALPYEVFEIDDYESRYYCILRLGIEKNITSIATLNPGTILLLCQKIEKFKNEIIKDIEKGTISKIVYIDDRIRSRLKKMVRPDPEKAATLRKILEERGALLPKHFWPNLKLISCWKGGTVKFHLKDLPHYFGYVPIRDIGCLSSEARSSIPITNEGAGGILAINTNFYEFIPKEDIDKDDKRIFLCDQLQKGKEYFLVVTTPGGLYRYNMDDIVKVTGFFNKTPVIEFVQKGLHAVSAAGEKLYESHVSEAMNAALLDNKLSAEFFSAIIEWKKMPRYTFLVEFLGNPSHSDKARLLESLEQELYRQNIEYKEKRAAQLLNPPALKVVRQGSFEKYRDKKIREGAHDSQFKMPELVSDFDFQKNFEIEEEIEL